MISTADLQAAFEESDVEAITIRRRSPKWGSKWVVHATFHGQKLGRAAEPHRDLDACIRATLKREPRNPEPSRALADDLEDLL